MVEATSDQINYSNSKSLGLGGYIFRYILSRSKDQSFKLTSRENLLGKDSSISVGRHITNPNVVGLKV